MKKLQKFLIFIALAVLSSAFCGGGAEHALEFKQLYYDSGADDSLSKNTLNFGSGLKIEFCDLNGYSSVMVRLVCGEELVDSVKKEVDSNGNVFVELAKELQMFTCENEIIMEIHAFSDAEERTIIHRSVLENTAVEKLDDETFEEADRKEFFQEVNAELPVWSFAYVRFNDSPDNSHVIYGVGADRLGFFIGKSYTIQAICGNSIIFDTNDRIYEDGHGMIRADADFNEGDLISITIFDKVSKQSLQTLNYTIEKKVTNLQEVVLEDPEAKDIPVQKQKTEIPTEKPTEAPTEVPTEEPTEAPTEVPTEEPTEAPTEAPTEEPTPEPTKEPMPEVEIKLVAEDGEYLFSRNSQGKTVYVRNDSELWIECDIEPEENAGDFKWNISFLEVDGKRIGRKDEKGEFKIEGDLPKIDREYKLIAEYTWKDQSGVFEICVVKKGFDVWFAWADAPEKRIEEGITVGWQKTKDFLLCHFGDEEPEVKINGGIVELQPVEKEEEEEINCYNFELPKEGLLKIEMLDCYGNTASFEMTIDPEPFIELQSESIHPGETACGKTEPGAMVSLWKDDQEVCEAVNAGELGDFVLELPEDAVVGDAFEIWVNDETGNIVSKEFTLVKETAAPLELSMDEPAVINAANLDTGVLVQGVGQPKTVIYGHIEGSEEKIAATSRDQDGKWEFKLTAKHFNNVEGKHTVRLEYPYEQEGKLEFTAVLDTRCELTVKAITEDSLRIEGSTDPKARIYLEKGDYASRLVADEKGEFKSFSMENTPLVAGETVIVRAIDEYGNESETVEMVVEEVLGEKIVFTAEQKALSICIEGTAKPGYAFDIFMDNEKLVEGIEADNEGSFALEISTEAVDGGNHSFTAVYRDERFVDFASEKVKTSVDTDAPTLTLEQDSFNTQSTLVSGFSSEKATVILTDAEGQIASAETDENGHFEVAFDKQQEGETLQLYAIDTFGNQSEADNLEIEPGMVALAIIKQPAAGVEISYLEPVFVSGYMLIAEPADKAELTVDGVRIELEEKDLPEEIFDAHETLINSRQYMPFECFVDLSKNTLGNKKIQLLMDGFPVSILHEDGSVSDFVEFITRKPGDFVIKRAVQMLALLLGIILCAAKIKKANQKIKLIHEAEIDSNNKSRLTISRKDNG